MKTYIIKRVLASIPVMVLVAVIVFLLLHLAPGDPAATIAGNYATPEQVANIRAQLGLDQPVYIQFFQWMGRLTHGDLGSSIFYNVPVVTLIGQRLEPTLSLTLMTLLIAAVLALPAGVLAAWNRDSWLDRTIMGLSVIGFSVPVFVIGYGLIYFFSVYLKLLPVQGYASLSDGIILWLRSIILPSLGLGFIHAALIARVTRATMIEVLGEDFIRTAKAKGLPLRLVLVRHALSNAAVPIVTIFGLSFVLLIGGVVVTESVFNIPGLGRLIVDAINQRDFPIIQAMLLIFSGIYVLVNLVIDVLYTVLDPRIRY